MRSPQWLACSLLRPTACNTAWLPVTTAHPDIADLFELNIRRFDSAAVQVAAQSKALRSQLDAAQQALADARQSAAAAEARAARLDAKAAQQQMVRSFRTSCLENLDVPMGGVWMRRVAHACREHLHSWHH